MVERALHANADLASGTSAASAVLVACESGHENVLRVLLVNGATVDAVEMTKLVSVTIDTRRFDLTRLLIGERMNALSADLRENAALCAWLFRRVVLVFDSLLSGSMSSATEEATTTRCEEVTKLLLAFCWKHSQPSNVFYALARSCHGLSELENIRLLLDDVASEIRQKVVSEGETGAAGDGDGDGKRAWRELVLIRDEQLKIALTETRDLSDALPDRSSVAEARMILK
ncbi:hypothetical protein Gpo141_00015017, partial [Globisporangium polare]